MQWLCDFSLAGCSTAKAALGKWALFQPIFRRSEKASDAHEASGPCECERRLKRVYTNITRYVCGVFGGVKQCKGDELGKKQAKVAWKRGLQPKLRILSFPIASYEPL